MMPTIRISDATFAKLQHIAVPLVDTPSSVIDRLVEKYLSENLSETAKGVATPLAERGPAKVYTNSDVPGLTHTKLLSASIDGGELTNPNWNKLLVSVINEIAGKGTWTKSQEIVSALNVRAEVGNHNHEGLRYIKELGVSVQGQPSVEAWREIVRLTRKYGLVVGAKIQWRDVGGAEFPGKETTLKAFAVT